MTCPVHPQVCPQCEAEAAEHRAQMAWRDSVRVPFTDDDKLAIASALEDARIIEKFDDYNGSGEWWEWSAPTLAAGTAPSLYGLLDSICYIHEPI